MKRIGFVLLLISLFVSATRAADKYVVATGNWSAAAVWAATPGGAGGDGKPAIGDDVYTDSNSDGFTVTMDENSADALNSFTMNSTAVIVGTGYTLYVGGDVTYAAGTATALTLVQTGTANMAWNTSTNPILVYDTDATSVITMTGYVYFGKGSLHASATLTGAYTFYAYVPSVNDFLDMAGTVDSSVTVRITLDADRSNSGALKGGTVDLFASGANRTLTQSGAITASSIQLKGLIDNIHAELILGVTGCNLGAVTLGAAGGVDRHGRLDLGNGTYAVTIASLINAVTAGDPPTNELDFGDAIIALTGTLDGQYITCIGETTGGLPCTIEGGTIQDVDISGYAHIDARGIGGSQPADGGGNDNVRFARGLVGGGVL